MKETRPDINFFGKMKELLYLNSYINIMDNKACIIENCKQIIECNEIMAKVLTGSFEVEIWGQNLQLTNYCTECVEVRGTIQSVNLTSRKIKEREK